MSEGGLIEVKPEPEPTSADPESATSQIGRAYGKEGAKFVHGFMAEFLPNIYGVYGTKDSDGSTNYPSWAFDTGRAMAAAAWADYVRRKEIRP